MNRKSAEMKDERGMEKVTEQEERYLQDGGAFGDPYADENNREVIVVREIIVVNGENTGAEVVNSLIALGIVFVGTQIVSSLWKRYHPKSFGIVSVATLLLFPLFMGVLARSYFFICAWLFVAFVHLVVFQDVFMGRRPKLLTTNVYNVYRVIFQASLVASIAGYLMVAYGFFKRSPGVYSRGMSSLLYTLYFTLITRTCLDIVSDRTSGAILPSKAAKTQSTQCPMCQESLGSKKITLECRESFHIDCIKNWKILGKKDTCPSCKEKVDLGSVEMNPWQKNEYLFTKFLDFTGNLILAYAVIQGIILFM
ncbi:RING finger protein 121/175 [Nematocida major]|uniref:RING finger protein 121/175 n=1 Tax=Nematocida major TaxID=1912982 RepID=UPI002008ACE6|nr:RING finger protein 121/175 [Nematocida major]KAH9386379.1 RING finger protein 121/175 [Nematocida major]